MFNFGDDIKHSYLSCSLLENLIRNSLKWQPVFAIVVDSDGNTMVKFDSNWFNDETKEVMIGLLEYWTEMLKKGVDKPLIKNVH